LAATWCKNNQDSFPPVVINVTDGIPNDLQHGGDGKKTKESAMRLLKLATNHGNLLFFNAHIGDHSKGQTLLPNQIENLQDTYAKYLFEISSVIPENLLGAASGPEFTPKKGARGLVFNSGAENLTKFLLFGSSVFR
jgi:hypothetical protein